MTDIKDINNYQNSLCECPRCHIKLISKDIRLHNIKCRMLNNQIEKNMRKNSNLKNTPKDEYKEFIDKIKETEIDDQSIKSIMKNFILLLGNKIETLEKNIKEINDRVANINKEKTLYFKKISDSLDNINKKYINKEDKNKKKETDFKARNNKITTFHKNETDINKCIPRDMGKRQLNKKKSEITPFSLKEKEEPKIENKMSNSKKTEKKQFQSDKNIIEINKQTMTQINENNNNNINEMNNKREKYIEAIKREKKKDNKYKEKKLKPKNSNYDFTQRYKTINNLQEDNILNNTISNCNITNHNNNLQKNMRRSLSFGDLNDFCSNKKNKKVDEKNGDEDDDDNNIDNYEDDDILVDSLDIIMNKISNLEKTLINLGLDNEDLKEKIFNIKSKEFEYSCSNSNSFNSENENN